MFYSRREYNSITPQCWSGTTHLGWGLNHQSRIGWEGGGGYLQNFEVVETLESVAWDIPQLIPWDTPRREAQRSKRRKQNIKVKNEIGAHTQKSYKSHKRSFAFCCILCFWIELWYDFILEFLLWGYWWGSMQITIFNSLQCGCYWPEAHPETLTNPGSSDEWVKTELNETETGSTSAAWKYICLCACECVYGCVYSKVYTIYAFMCVQCECVCYFPSPWGKLGPFWGALRTARERNHTHSHKQSNQFVYQTQHLMVICECV